MKDYATLAAWYATTQCIPALKPCMLANGPFIILNISVSSPSRAMFYSIKTVRLTEAAFKLLFHHASPLKGGLIWSHQIMNSCGCGFILRAYLVHSLASLLVLCTSLKHPLTYNGLMLVISSSVLTLLSPLTLTAG